MCHDFLCQLYNLEKVGAVWKQNHKYVTLGESAGSGNRSAVLNRSTRNSRISQRLLYVPIFCLASEAPVDDITILCTEGRTFDLAELVRSLWTGTVTFLGNPTQLCWPSAATGVPWCSMVQNSQNRKKNADFRGLGVQTISPHFSDPSVWGYLNCSFPDSGI